MAQGVNKLIGTIVPIVIVIILAVIVLPTVLGKLSTFEADRKKALADQANAQADQAKANKLGFFGYAYDWLFGTPNPPASDPNTANQGKTPDSVDNSNSQTDSAKAQAVADANTIDAGTGGNTDTTVTDSIGGSTPSTTTKGVNGKPVPQPSVNTTDQTSTTPKPSIVSTNKISKPKAVAGASQYQSIIVDAGNLPTGDLSNTVTISKTSSKVSNPTPQSVSTTPAERLAEYNASLAKLQSSIKGNVVLNSQPVRTNKGGVVSSTISSPSGIKKVGGASQFQNIIKDAGNLPV